MKALQACLMGMALVLSPVALAHERPAERTVVVQTEEHGVAVLVGWKEPLGAHNRAVEAAAAAGFGRAAASNALVRRWVTQALAPLRFVLDGHDLDLDEIEVKVLEDPPDSGHYAVAVLLTADWTPGAHELVLQTRQSLEQTRIQWLDRSHDEVEELHQIPAQTWVGPGTSMTWTWGTR